MPTSATATAATVAIMRAVERDSTEQKYVVAAAALSNPRGTTMTRREPCYCSRVACFCLVIAMVVGAGSLHPHVERDIFDLNGTITRIDALNRTLEVDTVDPGTKQTRNVLLFLDGKVKLRSGKMKVDLSAFRPGQRVNCTVERTHDDADVERLVARTVRLPAETESRAVSSAHVTFRVIGTIAKVTATKLDVTNKDGKTFSMDVTRRTVIRRLKEEKKLPISALKAGQSVVVDAFNAYAEEPDDDSELEALDIRIVPPITNPLHD